MIYFLFHLVENVCKNFDPFVSRLFNFDFILLFKSKIRSLNPFVNKTRLDGNGQAGRSSLDYYKKFLVSVCKFPKNSRNNSFSSLNPTLCYVPVGNTAAEMPARVIPVVL